LAKPSMLAEVVDIILWLKTVVVKAAEVET
jgi:hypothetical protein